MTARAGVQCGHVRRLVINGHPAGSSDGRLRLAAACPRLPLSCGSSELRAFALLNAPREVRSRLPARERGQYRPFEEGGPPRPLGVRGVSRRPKAMKGGPRQVRLWRRFARTIQQPSRSVMQRGPPTARGGAVRARPIAEAKLQEEAIQAWTETSNGPRHRNYRAIRDFLSRRFLKEWGPRREVAVAGTDLCPM
jgi:hypothetical protein